MKKNKNQKILHFTYLNLYIISPIKKEDELKEKVAGCVSSWPVGQAYIHTDYPIGLEG